MSPTDPTPTEILAASLRLSCVWPVKKKSIADWNLEKGDEKVRYSLDINLILTHGGYCTELFVFM